jgi:hypothetical protein
VEETMFSQSQWDELVSKWNRIINIAKKRNWEVSELKKNKPEKSKNIFQNIRYFYQRIIYL